MNIFNRCALVLALFVAVCGVPARAAGTTPQTHDENLQAGNEVLTKGQMDKAAAFYDQSIKLSPDSSVAYLMHGTALLGKADYAGAVKDFTKSIELNKYEFVAHRRRAEAYEKLGRTKEAASDKKLAAQRLAELAAPTTADAWFNRGSYLEDRAEYLEAIDAYDAAIKLNPAYKSALAWKSIYERRGDLLFLTMEPGKAAEDYTKALETQPNNIDLLLKRGRANSLMSLVTQDPEPALKDFTAIIARAPDLKNQPERLVEAYVTRAEILLDKQDYPAAITDLDAALALDAGNLQALSARGYANRRLGKTVEAFADLNTVIAKNANVVNVWVERAALFADQGDYSKALADYDRAVTLAPKDAFLRSDRGATWFAKGDMDKALLDFSAAILLNPKLVSAWNNRGAAYARKEDWTAAIADYTKALELNPAHRSAYLNRATAYRKIDKPDLATADEAKAKELEPKAP